MIRHGEKHDAVALNIPGFDKGLFVGFPDAVDDGRLSRIGRSTMIELPAQIDYSHFKSPPFDCGPTVRVSQQTGRHLAPLIGGMHGRRRRMPIWAGSARSLLVRPDETLLRL